MKNYILFALMVCLPINLHAYWGEIFTTEPYGQPMLSEIHSPIFKVEQNIGLALPEYDISFDNKRMSRAYVTVDLGKNIPLYSYNTAKWGISIVAPVSMHTWVDMYEDITAPVLDIDYRFGFARTTFIWRFDDNNKFLKNITVQLSPLMHECTHIGDELALYRKDEGIPLTRVNISYEYLDFNVTLNDPDGKDDNRHTFKIGASVRLSDRGEGYFSIRPQQECGTGNIDCEVTEFDQSTRRWEFYAAYQMQRTEGFLASVKWRNILSIEGRLRVKYAYPIYYKDINLDGNADEVNDGSWQKAVLKEVYQPGVNAYFGYKFTPDRPYAPPVGLYIHGYMGINPYGQFRSIPVFYTLGFALVVG